MAQLYPSNIDREQFEAIHPILEWARKKTKPRQVDLYEIFSGLVYLLKTGCQWRMSPKYFPKWRTVHAYFQLWSQKQENGLSFLEEALKKYGYSYEGTNR